MIEFAASTPLPGASGSFSSVAGVLSLLLAVGCAAKSQSHHLERVPLNERACWDPPTCFEVLERSSEVAAQAYAEEHVAAFGAVAIPRLSWLVGEGDLVSKHLASGALGRIAATRPNEVLAVAGDALREHCADEGWSACWALAQTKDHSVYPLLAKHLRDGIDAWSLFDGRAVPAVVAEWFIVEIEDRAASAAIHSGVVDALHRAEGTLSDASLERVRKLLRAELPPDLSNVPSGYPCRTSGRGCWARIDYLVAAVGAWGPRGFQARDEVRAVWESTPAPHKDIARSTRAQIGDRAIIPSLLRELSPLDERALQDLTLLGKVAQPELPQLIALFRNAPGSERAALFQTIMAIGGPLAVTVGVEALHNPADDDATALKGLLEARRQGSVLGPIREEKSRLEYLATRSSYRQVRELAGELLVALGFEAPAPREPLACPPVVGSGQLVPQARLTSGPVIFERLESSEGDSGECATGSMPTLRVGDECLRGYSSGEFGYKITVSDARSERPRGTVRGVALNPVHFIRYGEHLLIIEALEHGSGIGNIDRLIRDSNGRWVAHRFTDLPGPPMGYAFDGDGKLLVLVSEAFPGLCHDENGGWQVLRIGTDGETETLW